MAGAVCNITCLLMSTQRRIACEGVLAKDEALQQTFRFDYAYLLAPEPTISPWLICFTGSPMKVNSGS
jgi:hypothetical protein